MKKKQVIAVSSALMIGTTTALTGLPTSVMAQENTEVVQENITDKEQEESKNTEVKAGSIAIDEAHFPNQAFRLFVETNFDKDKDKSLSKEEINNVTSMNIQERYNREFTSIKGIEYFTNLQDLSLAAPLKELDLSKNTSLKNLEIIGLNMWGFDVSKNTNLKSLTADTHYTWYNIGNNPNLETVNVGNTNPVSYTHLTLPTT